MPPAARFIVFLLFTPLLPAAARPGATTPWLTYDATQAAAQRAEILDSRTPGDLANESVNRRCLRLSAEGDHLEWEVQAPANALVIRHSIPDAPAGGGTTATLSLWVNGRFRQKLALDSGHAWLYGPKENGQDNAPSAGGPPHRVFDEARAFLSGEPLRPGDRLRLQKDPGDTAAWYAIDLVDLELVPPPIPAPAGAISILDCGAIADDDRDDTAAIEQAVARARGTGAVIWLPPGTYHQTKKIEVPGVAIAGAGPWHTRLAALGPATEEMGFPGNCGFNLTGERPQVRDLLIEGSTTSRGKPRQHAFSGGGRDFLIDNVWVEHVKTGLWLGAAQGGVIRRCRVRNLYADGINLNSGTSGVTVEDCHFRNTGDDSLASFSNSNKRGAESACTDITFRHNTVEAPWWAHGIGIYGGTRIVAEDNLIRGVARAPGIKVAASSFHGHKDWPGEDIRIARNIIADCGGTSWKQTWGGLWLYLATGDLRGIVIEDNRILRPVFDGIKIQGGDDEASLDALLRRNAIVSPGADGVLITAKARGTLRLEANAISGLASGRQPLVNRAAAGAFSILETPPAH